MDIRDAVTSRRSVRAFLDKPVPQDAIRRVLETALRAPSGGNLQPWHLHVVTGDSLSEIKRLAALAISTHSKETPEYNIYPPQLTSPYKERRFEIGEVLYGRLGIPRDDKVGRARWFQQNFEFFGAPVGLFCTVDRQMGPPQWSDLGMLLQTIMLLLRGEGLDSCPQECWALFPQTIGKFLKLPSEQMLFAGMAIGYADEANPVNQPATPRASFDEVVTVYGPCAQQALE